MTESDTPALTCTALRRQMGHVMRAVELDGRTYLVTRYGRSVAAIVPLPGEPEVGPLARTRGTAAGNAPR